MRLILSAILAMGVCGQAWAWDDEDKYPFGGSRSMDELEVEYGQPSYPGKGARQMELDNYYRRLRDYNEATARLSLDSQRKTERLLKQQQEILKRLDEKDVWEDVPMR